MALVTGASRGIGAAIASSLAEAGVKVGVNYNTSREAAEKVVEKITENGGEALLVGANVAEEASAEAAVKLVMDRWGQIDILVNNAAALGPIGPLQDREASDWIRTIQVNVIGTYLCCRMALPVMLR